MADLAAVVDLLAEVAAEGRWIGTEQIDREQRHADLLSKLASPDDGMFVADAAGGLIGQIGLTLRPFGVVDLGMFVSRDWRKRGVGSALLGAGIDWARHAGAHKMALQVWPHNEAAIGLYRKFGFAEEGVLRRHYRRRNGDVWDAVLMGRLLEEPAGPGRS